MGVCVWRMRVQSQHTKVQHIVALFPLLRLIPKRITASKDVHFFRAFYPIVAGSLKKQSDFLCSGALHLTLGASSQARGSWGWLGRVFLSVSPLIRTEMSYPPE